MMLSFSIDSFGECLPVCLECLVEVCVFETHSCKQFSTTCPFIGSGLCLSRCVELLQSSNACLTPLRLVSVGACRRVLVIETGWRSYVKFFKSEMNISQVVSCDDNSPRMSNTDFRVGDVMNFRIEEFSVSPYGNMVLGSGEAGPEQRKELVWEELEKCQNEGREVMGRVLNSVNGGYAVGIAGWVTFCPFSAISVTTAGRIGVLQPFVINRMSRQKGNIVVREAQTSEPTYSPYGGYQGNRGPGGFFGGSRRPDDGN